MQDQNNDDRPAVKLMLRDQLPVPALHDLPAQRFRYWVFALLALILAISLYLLLNTSQLLDRFQGRLASVEDSDTLRIRQYNQKLEDLQQRMTVFVADSVETKLKALERNVTDGTVGAQELRALEDLKGEVRMLEQYSAGKGGNLTDASRLDHARFQTTPGSQATVSNGELLYEVSQMKRLLYIGIASCGFVGFLVGGYWWHGNYRLKRLAKEMPLPRLLVRKSQGEM